MAERQAEETQTEIGQERYNKDSSTAKRATGRMTAANSVKPFSILEQQDKKSGCIPACAASLLRWHAVGKKDWKEAELMAMYKHPATTGFDTLKNFLAIHPDAKGWEVVVSEAGTKGLKEFATETVTEYGPALMPVNGSPAHCVVITDPDENGASICDPAQPTGNRRHFTWAEIAAIWIGGLSYLTQKSP